MQYIVAVLLLKDQLIEAHDNENDSTLASDLRVLLNGKRTWCYRRMRGSRGTTMISIPDAVGAE